VPDFWLDSDSFITPNRGPYAFDIAPGFWAFLERVAGEGVIASSRLVYEELHGGTGDDLSNWAEAMNERGFFVDPDAGVQAAFQEIADYVNNRYPPHQAAHFLGGADPWIIAHAKAYAGVVVTFEARAGRGQQAQNPRRVRSFRRGLPESLVGFARVGILPLVFVATLPLTLT